jgi:hypothetical protein
MGSTFTTSAPGDERRRDPARMLGLQADFVQAVLDPDLPPPHGVVSHHSTLPRGRFAIYRNNVMVALVGALEARFPAARRIVGEAFFVTLARAFAASNPPQSPLMIHYGDDFPAFVESFEPAASVPYLADVARLEAARTRAYHAADATPLPLDALATAFTEAADRLVVDLHPSFEIVTSKFPLVTIFAMNIGEAEAHPIADWSEEDALVMRPEFDVEVRRVPRGGAIFLEALRLGAPIGAAVAEAHGACADFDLAENIVFLFSSRLVVAIRSAVAT